MTEYIHKELAKGRWFELSLAEQMGNIGSEVGRAANTQGKNEERFQGAVDRALDLFDLTLTDPRWIRQKRLLEITRAREVFCDAVLGGKEYGSSLKDLEKYFLPFALEAMKKFA
ncbi:MAG: hypothetical protein Q8O98_02515 [bacterium]|nr:hypothetical protein [bacterium]